MVLKLKIKYFIALSPKSYCGRWVSWMDKFLNSLLILAAYWDEEDIPRLYSKTYKIF